MSKPVAETAVVTSAGSAEGQETPLQCILYYSNPNFINDQDNNTTIQFGNDEDDDDEDEEDEDEEEEEEEEEEDYDDSNDAVKTQAFDQHQHHDRHHNHQQHHHHHQQQLQVMPGGLQGVDDLGSLEDQELDADYFEQDAASDIRPTSMVGGSIRGRQRQFSQQRLVGGGGGIGVGGTRGPVSMACICRATLACLRTKPCLFFIYVVVVLVLLSSFVSVVLVAVLVVEPFARVAGFVNGTCRTLEVSVGREEQSCSCGKGCNSKYFCLKIQVEYFDVQADATLTATLYEDETSLNRQCSFYPPCRSSRQENEEAVHIYERLYGRPGLEFSCWYSPQNNGSTSLSHLRGRAAASAVGVGFARASGGGEVVQSKRFQAHHVAHGLVWSTLLFFGSFSFLFYMFRRKGCFH